MFCLILATVVTLFTSFSLPLFFSPLLFSYFLSSFLFSLPFERYCLWLNPTLIVGVFHQIWSTSSKQPSAQRPPQYHLIWVENYSWPASHFFLLPWKTFSHSRKKIFVSNTSENMKFMLENCVFGRCFSRYAFLFWRLAILYGNHNANTVLSLYNLNKNYL